MSFVVNTYTALAKRRKLLWFSLTCFILLFVSLIVKLNYSENIDDFLPLGTSDKEALELFKNISGAERIYMLFSNSNDEDRTIEAAEYFFETVNQLDSTQLCGEITAQYDMRTMQEMPQFMYSNMPYFLTTADYARMDSLLLQPGYLDHCMQLNKQKLMFPSMGITTSTITHDPLGLFSPVFAPLQRLNPQVNFEMYEGYIFTPDMSRCIAMMDSPYGNTETNQNSQMLAVLHQAADSLSLHYPDVPLHIIGGPEIAVGNASRIKQDTVITVMISVILITLLIVYAIGSVRNLLLIFLSIGWGGLFALAGMSLLVDKVSIIVLGISSVIVGIAVNYPLHLIVHHAHQPNIKATLKDLLRPLLIGNITTVGAFMTLIPLKSVALRDLGLFASLLLVGTILFVIFYLPHLLSSRKITEKRSQAIDKIARMEPDKNKWITTGVVALTAVLLLFSFHTEFDSNVANINYMTDEMRSDMQYFQQILSDGATHDTRQVYVFTAAPNYDEALMQNTAVVQTLDSLQAAGLINHYKGVAPFLVSKQEQQQRLDQWHAFVNKHRAQFTTELTAAAQRQGFSAKAFAPFQHLVEKAGSLTPQDMAFFAPLTHKLLSQQVAQVGSTQKSYIVNTLTVHKDQVENIKTYFDNSFDVVSMNSALSNNLSDNFNYIGLVCSTIVFLFLWFSFGRIELAIIAFVPMVVSWIWILGLMSLLGIKFNIVNVILATFIFGQGDDYTIFMTEGCQYEYTHGKPVLASYKSSILQSALIMLVSIGTLIFAQHPAMRSLAEVTIVGMLSVVLMSFTLPPWLFGLLTQKNGKPRLHPITLKTLIKGVPKNDTELVIGRYLYKGTFLVNAVKQNLKNQVPALEALPVNGAATYAYTDTGYGECALLLALRHPSTQIVVTMPDDEKRNIALMAAQGWITNIEFKP